MSGPATSTNITGGQYSLFRVLFGAYLAVHFWQLSSYAAELFSFAGMLPDAAVSPLFAIAPSLLHLSDAPWAAVLLVASGVPAAIAFAAGRWDRLMAVWMLLVLVSVFARNPLIANPAMPYVGFMLLAHLAVPCAPYGSLEALGRADPAGGWRMPRSVFMAAVIVLAASYSYSGLTKLFSDTWVAGDTIRLVLQNPLARDWVLRDLFLAMPEGVLQGLTWFVLYVELLFAPLYLMKGLRPWLWGAMLGVQLGFLLLLRFPDLTLPMLLFHLFTFDPRWLPARRAAALLRYDGECGVCHLAVRFAIAENGADLTFRPMQADGVDAAAVSTWEIVEGDATYTKTDAVIRLLTYSGGLWGLAALALRSVPRSFRDGGYDALARIRRRLAPRPPELCPLVSPELRRRFAE